MEIKQIGVIGAGIMGQGVAHQFAKYNYQVVLVDVSEEKLQEARQKIKNITRLDLLLKKGSNPTQGDLMEKIRFTTDLNELANADFIVENIIENLQEKKVLYSKIRDIVKDTARVAVNTSCVSITKIGSLMNDAKNILGIHFMNPVHLKPTVEVIRGVYTTEESIQIALDLLKTANMNGIVVNDSPGFVSNRILMLTVNEAVFTLQDGVASAKDIDRIHKECFGHTMGPLETADLIGLDTILFSVEVLYESFNDSKYRPAPLLKKMVDSGKLGRKSGEGFFKY